MKILAIDTSSKICSVSILEDNKLIIEKHNNDEKTHSQKLMPLIDMTFKEANLCLDDIDLLACCQGPGSFTGIRIGISTVKAFADVKNIPIIGVTSLESLAYNIKENALIATIIDAKNNNVYFALYNYNSNTKTYSSICEPRTDNIDNIIEIINSNMGNVKQNYSNNKLILVGDGAIVNKKLLKNKISNCNFASDSSNIQTSISVGLSAFDKYNSNSYVPCYTVSPIYLKKSQAERTLSGEK